MVDNGHRRTQDIGRSKVAERHKGDVGSPTQVQGSHDAEGCLGSRTEDGGWRHREVEHVIGARLSLSSIDASGGLELNLDGESEVAHRPEVPLTPQSGGLDSEPIGEKRDAAVPEGGEVHDDAMRTSLVVDDDSADVDPFRMAVEEHDRGAHPLEE